MSKDINFVEVDADTIINDMISDFEALANRKLSDSDPIQLLIRWAANIIIQERMLINNAAKMNLRTYATGEQLDVLADFIGCERLQAKAAETTMRFYISKTLEYDYIIPQGTRISVNELVFSTTKQLSIQQGSIYGDVTAICTTTGTNGNDCLPGTITELVDVFQYYEKCENITTSNGGTNIETDEELRERMKLLPESYSTAGPIGAYKYLVKSASNNIVDVYVTSPTPGTVSIYPLCDKGTLPTSELIEDIELLLNDDKSRPLTDKVNVYKPSELSYNIDFKYFISKDNESIAKDISKNIAESVNNYIDWQESKLGRAINPSKLTELVMGAGASRVEITSPIYKLVPNNSVAKNANLNIKSGGIEND